MGVTLARLLVAVLLVGGCSDSGGLNSPGTSPDTSPANSNAGDIRTHEEACGDLDWCHVVRGRLPAMLVRPLRLPKLQPSESCPKTAGHRYSNGQFSGIALGKGPVQPLIAPNRRKDIGPATHGVLRFRRAADRPGWHSIKTLWFSKPNYQGPAVVRGRQLDGSSKVVFGEGPSLIDPFLSAGATINGELGFREWPGATWLRSPGCYGWQVDGKDFSHVIVFRADF